MRCGHTIHSKCFKSLVKFNGICPICKKSLIEQSSEITEEIDKMISEQKMPQEYIREVNILCNECLQKSTVMFHFLGNKCNKCNSYNTSILKSNPEEKQN